MSNLINDHQQELESIKKSNDDRYAALKEENEKLQIEKDEQIRQKAETEQLHRKSEQEINVLKVEIERVEETKNTEMAVQAQAFRQKDEENENRIKQLWVKVATDKRLVEEQKAEEIKKIQDDE